MNNVKTPAWARGPFMAVPLLNFHLLGTGHPGVRVDSRKVYVVEAATNQPDWMGKRKIFMDGILLTMDDYVIVSSRCVKAPRFVWEVVRKPQTLRAMERAGLINEPPEHVRPRPAKWGSGNYHYVDTVVPEGDGLTTGRAKAWVPTTYSNGDYPRHFKLEYFDGCFMPFVMELKLNYDELTT